MSFSVISLPAPKTAPTQVKETITANNDTTIQPSINGVKFAVLDNNGDLGYREVHSAIGEISLPALNIAQIDLTQNVPALISHSSNILSAFSSNFAMLNDGIMTYTGNKNNILAIVNASITVKTTTDNTQFEFFVRKNGVLIAGSTQRMGIRESDMAEVISLNCITQLNINDTISLWITNLTNNNDVAPYHYNFIVHCPTF